MSNVKKGRKLSIIDGGKETAKIILQRIGRKNSRFSIPPSGDPLFPGGFTSVGGVNRINTGKGCV